MTCCVTQYLRDLFVHTCEPAVKMTSAHPQSSVQIQSVKILKKSSRLTCISCHWCFYWLFMPRKMSTSLELRVAKAEVNSICVEWKVEQRKYFAWNREHSHWYMGWRGVCKEKAVCREFREDGVGVEGEGTRLAIYLEM